jgi:ATP-dependent RNA helicase DHX57
MDEGQTNAHRFARTFRAPTGINHNRKIKKHFFSLKSKGIKGALKIEKKNSFLSYFHRRGMPKKGKTPANNSKTTPKCTCQDPFKCDCGNRPERPSKGHKWDPETQTWGGKGHKQKGASGQTASVAQKATTTAVGQTSVAQWQRLPSQLLQEYCKKNKRPLPKFENKSKNAKYHYRVILPDGKNAQKDLFFQPMHAVGNQEQAREEACLLALLSMTPNLPHERTLPEPYRTTWLHAIASIKEVEKPSSTTPTPKQSTTQKAQASKELKLATTFTSKAEQKRLLEEKRKLKNQRMQRHEAIRRANKDHVVSMSAAMRRQIERLLRGEHVDWDDMSSEEEEEDPVQDDLEYYVQDRLHREGFTRKQARTAYRQVEKSRVRDKHDSKNENEWDVAFEECLQWLLVNLDEDQLPEGVDPDKGNVTLNVGVASTNAASTGLGTQWGLSNAEVKLVEASVDDNLDFESALWSMLVEKAGVTLPETKLADISLEQREINKSMFQEEVEALEAIYSADFKLQTQASGLHTIEIISCQGEMVLRVVIREGLYPLLPPEKVWLTGQWGSRFVGSAYHMELVKFLADLPLGDPMIFELHGYAQMLFETVDELPSQQLIDGSSLNSNKRTTNNVPRREEKKSDKVEASHMDTAKHTRPRERKPFWCQLPTQTPKATPFPKISTAIEMARKSLPAAKARDDFLKLLRQAEESGRVLLLTGETGCGKTTQIPQVRSIAINKLKEALVSSSNIPSDFALVYFRGVSKGCENCRCSAQTPSSHRRCESRCCRERRVETRHRKCWLCCERGFSNLR